MGLKDNAKALIDANVYANGQEQITGQGLNATLKGIVDILPTTEEIVSGIKGVATTSTVPSPTGFERYLVHEAGTYTNFSGIVVTAADLDIVGGVANNRVILEVSEGVATKRVERVKGDEGVVDYNTGILSPTSTDKAETGKSVADFFGKAIQKTPEFNELDESIAVTVGEYKTVEFIPILPNTQYILSTKGGIHAYFNPINFYDENKALITAPTLTVYNLGTRSGKIFTTPANARFLSPTWRFKSGATPLIEEVMLTKGNTLSDYVPYKAVYKFTETNYLTEKTLKEKRTAYVAFDGLDTNAGTIAAPFKTLQKAVNYGVSTIFIKRGKYYEQSFSASNVDEINILPYPNDETYAFANPKRQLIEFINAKEITGLTLVSGLYEATFAGQPLWNEVFVTKTQTPINGLAPRVVLWKTFTDITQDFRLTPVTTLAACTATVDSFFWDGSKVYINSTAGGQYMATNNIPVFLISNCAKLNMEDVSVRFYNYQGFDLDNIASGFMRNCRATHVNYSNGFSMDNCNLNLYNCRAYKAQFDGFNIHKYGIVNMYNCDATHNYDDGVSHHDGADGEIVGGDFSYNGKAGIAPAYGANVNINGAKATYNAFGGIAFLSTPNGHPTFKGRVSNCLITNNLNGLVVNPLASVVAWNNTIQDNTTNILNSGTLLNYP